MLAVYAGLRPLAAPKENADGSKTKEISRKHKLVVSPTGLVTITGGKWTTYQDMAQDVVDRVLEVGNLIKKDCVTKHLKIHGYMENVDRSGYGYVYGSDYEKILALQKQAPEYSQRLHERLDFTVAEVVWAVREEMAVTVEDVLARRLRALFMDARAAIDMTPKVASVMAKELGEDTCWENEQVDEFIELAQQYLLTPYQPFGN